MNLKQSHRSLLAVLFSILFLWTGKKFVWKSPDDTLTEPEASPEISTAEENPMAETAPVITSLTVTDTIVTSMTATETIFVSEPVVPIESHTGTSALTLSTTTQSSLSSTTVSAMGTSTGTSGTDVSTTAAETTAAVVRGVPTTAPEGYFDDALFIGDSRTVGLASFAPIDGATYFATTGLSTYKIDNAQSEAPDTKGQSFESVLNSKTFTKVYIMLGINELGSDFNTTIENYKGIIRRIQSAQSNAIIYVMANLHVDAARSARDSVVNNTKINQFNELVKGLSDNNKVYYLDVNPIFDDENGNLTAEYTSDGTHPYAKHYPDWVEWIKNHVIIK